MAQTIWKYPLAITDEQLLDMPEGAQLLTVQVQGDQLVLWAQVCPDHPTVNRRIVIFGSAHPMDCAYGKYVATVQTGSLVLHVYDGLHPEV